MGRTRFEDGAQKVDQDGLTQLQRRFVTFWPICNGNASEAARLAGYAESKGVGSEVLHKPAVQAAIKKQNFGLQAKFREKGGILKALGGIADDAGVKMSDRLKAFDMLLRATGGYLVDSVTMTKQVGDEKATKVVLVPSDDDLEQSLEVVASITSVKQTMLETG